MIAFSPCIRSDRRARGPAASDGESSPSTTSALRFPTPPDEVSADFSCRRTLSWACPKRQISRSLGAIAPLGRGVGAQKEFSREPDLVTAITDARQ